MAVRGNRPEVPQPAFPPAVCAASAADVRCHATRQVVKWLLRDRGEQVPAPGPGKVDVPAGVERQRGAVDSIPYGLRDQHLARACVGEHALGDPHRDAADFAVGEGIDLACVHCRACLDVNVAGGRADVKCAMQGCTGRVEHGKHTGVGSFHYALDPLIEVVDEHRVHCLAGALGQLGDLEIPVLGKLPHRLRRVREERGSGAQQPLVSRERALAVAHRKPRAQADRHAFTRTPQPAGPAPRRRTGASARCLRARRRWSPRRPAAVAGKLASAARRDDPHRRHSAQHSFVHEAKESRGKPVPVAQTRLDIKPDHAPSIGHPAAQLGQDA